jgi:hypothetical protein
MVMPSTIISSTTTITIIIIIIIINITIDIINNITDICSYLLTSGAFLTL